jgi:Beta-L-arabinofuranosidase, GH127
VNGEKSAQMRAAGKVICIDREWKAGDTLTLPLPMTTRVKTWERTNAVSVIRGPLTYSLEIKEKYVRYGGTDNWPAYDIFPDSPWNYGLEVDLAKPEESLRSVHGLPDSEPPFTPNGGPKILAKARRIPAWALDRRGLVNEVAPGPVKSSEPLEEVTLIPMGAARLRITAFPRIDNAHGKAWPPPARPKYLATASHCWDGDSLDAMCDDVVPKHSNDHTIDRFTWWPRKGSTEWAQYEFDKPIAVSSAAVYWFDDTPTKGGCKLPKSWRLLYRDGKDWKPVPEPTEYPVAKDQFSEVRFKDVTTSALRLEVQLETGYSGGILEWRVK